MPFSVSVNLIFQLNTGDNHRVQSRLKMAYVHTHVVLCFSVTSSLFLENGHIFGIKKSGNWMILGNLAVKGSKNNNAFVFYFNKP